MGTNFERVRGHLTSQEGLRPRLAISLLQVHELGFRFVEIPEKFGDFARAYQHVNCISCKQHAKLDHKLVCLITGEVLCDSCDTNRTTKKNIFEYTRRNLPQGALFVAYNDGLLYSQIDK